MSTADQTTKRRVRRSRLPEQREEASHEPRWYIVHTYAGHEDRVAENLRQRVKTMDMTDRILEVQVPTEKEIERKRSKKDGKEKERSVDRKIFPGYILVRMKMDDEAWYVVRNTPGVTGFVSAEDERERRPKPVPLEEREVQQILNYAQEVKPRIKVAFGKGDKVRITEGPFVDFLGTVDEVYPERSKVRVLVSFFGRETPVELDFLQIEKST